ncbi:16S rRNA (cytosine967-C5)-methyltransferase [Sphingomonas vulcanisoli]|uniref:16S rRNA (Cytosine967-C5)-methyltransferase n=1 Tax=Sphingomonas vulcanisoli TaxID=1658060 RepID=A0ABX0TR76_9SPHN|nr:RsmB/NOP family class I SAM-dependent RNA methyltransferase [Sphingomonas vulcanisoli]NIJ07055.1 16S rRNA (cytosine967-C5)-methyltransferase [Sphingomonas vulcanisoli]
MTPAARLQAAIEIVDAVIGAARAGGAAADTLIQRYFRERRYAGSKDRRAVRELVYAAIRRAGEVPASGRAALMGLAADRPELRVLFDGSAHGPAPIGAGDVGAPASALPAWLAEKLSVHLDRSEFPALLERAPLDLRANRLKTDRDTLLAALPGARAGEHGLDAFRLPEGTQVDLLPEWQQGLFEIQDEGSQLIVQACGAQPRMVAVDLCAGAGGKTLALAAAMRNEGRLIACDVDRGRLAGLAPRAERAGAMIEQRLLDGGRERGGLADLIGAADLVLVDAPCSGSGTWRRNPEARWRLTPATLERLTKLQAQVLAIGADCVKPGGTLVYATCSLLPEEGPVQIDRFLGLHADFRADALAFGCRSGEGVMLTPAQDGTDGFFVARLLRA